MKWGGVHRKGFALITALAITVVVIVAVVAFLTEALRSRAQSLALGNAFRATTSAQSAADLGMAQLQALMTAHPDSATGWQASPTPATLFFYRTEKGLHSQPLHSGGEGQLAHPMLPFEDERNSVNLNHARFSGDRQGWIGSPQAGRLSIRVPWIEIPSEEPRQVTRYAWWIEDESFRLNLNQLGDTPRGSGPGALPSEVPLQGLLAAVLPELEDPDEVAARILGLRKRFPGGHLPETRILNPIGAGMGETLRFYLSPFSGALNVARDGRQRTNVNAIVSTSANPATVRAQLDALLAPIRRALPKFGQRFYTAPDGVSEAHAAIYLEKIAANLRDYLSADSQPTLVNADGSVRIGTAPAGAIAPVAPAADGRNNPVIAIGKENVPYLQEYACRVTLYQFQKAAQFAGYRFAVDHYFEFWNMGTRDISVAAGDLGEAPFLRIANLPGFDTDGGLPEIKEGRSVQVPLPSDLIFPAGKVTVLTTDGAPNGLLVRDAERLVKLSGGTEMFQGQTRLKTEDGKFRVNLLARHTATTDYGTQALLGNAQGLIESAYALPLVRGDSPGNNALSIHNDNQGNAVWDRIGGKMRLAYYVRGGSLRSNLNDLAVTGDPRTNNEQLTLRAYDASGDMEQSRYYQTELGNPSSTGVLNIPAQSTIGEHNTNFVTPALWPDPSPLTARGAHSPMFIANAPMQSIGELGHLFDPSREAGPTKNISYSRGGGRTLNIGQPDTLTPSANAQRELAAWRLTDLYSTTDALEQPGLVNLNGVTRDGGVALRALLHGFIFDTGAQADPALAGEPLEDEIKEQIVQALITRVQSDGPLMERGELSEYLSFLPRKGVQREELVDRGREEIFRRLVELVTTRGNVFTIYAIAQICAVGENDARTVLSTGRVRYTFALIPEWDGKQAPTQDAPRRFQLKLLHQGPHR